MTIRGLRENPIITSLWKPGFMQSKKQKNNQTKNTSGWQKWLSKYETRQALISDKWLSKVPFLKVRCTDLSGDLQGDVASVLRLDPAPSLPFTVAAVLLQGATIYKALAHCDGSVCYCHLYHISACSLPSLWGSGKNDRCEACEILRASWEKHKSCHYHHHHKCFHIVLRARADPVFSTGFSACVNPSSCYLPSKIFPKGA